MANLQTRTLFISLLSVVLATPAFACSCVESNSSLRDEITAKYRGADTVAVVEVVAIQRQTIDFHTRSETGRFAVLEVRHRFKGALDAGQKYYARMPSRFFRNSCDFEFELGKLLIVYASAPEVEPVAFGGCGPNQEVNFQELPYLYELSGQWPTPLKTDRAKIQ